MCAQKLLKNITGFKFHTQGISQKCEDAGDNVGVGIQNKDQVTANNTGGRRAFRTYSGMLLLQQKADKEIACVFSKQNTEVAWRVSPLL